MLIFHILDRKIVTEFDKSDSLFDCVYIFLINLKCVF